MNKGTSQDADTKPILKEYIESPIGILEIRYTDEWIHAVLFCKDKTILPSTKRNQSATLTLCIQQLHEYFEGTRKVFDFPFLQEGTSFQKKVWDELFAIPYGKTISYLELSRRIGDIKAIRAVGTANGRNNMAIVVPCHRVIGSNGSLIGYGGELWRKKWLLEHENKHANGVQVLFSNDVQDNSHKR